jgi:hypothetical protein
MSAPGIIWSPTRNAGVPSIAKASAKARVSAGVREVLGRGRGLRGSPSLGHVDADLSGDPHDCGLVEVLLGHQALMQLERLALVLGAQNHARGGFGVVAEDHEVLEHETHVGILLDHFDDLGRGDLAVAASVVEELDDRDRTVRVGHEVARIALQRLAILVHRAQGSLGLLGRLFLLELVAHLDQHLRVLDQIGVNLLTERLVGIGLPATDERQYGDERHRAEGQGHGDL